MARRLSPQIGLEAADPEARGVRVVPMRSRHLSGVLRIEEMTRSQGWSRSTFLSELAQPETRSYLVATVGHAVVGYAGAMVILDDGHITTVAVDEGHRRQRTASRLLLVLIDELRSRGAVNLTLEVRMGNVAARSLYQRFGFAPGGVRPGYYAQPTEDALIMWAHDVDSPEYAHRLAELETQLPTPTLR